MRRIFGTIGATLAIALMTPTLALAHSHREAPRIMLDPSADNTDVYTSFGAPLAIISVAALLVVPLLRGRDDDREDPPDD